MLSILCDQREYMSVRARTSRTCETMSLKCWRSAMFSPPLPAIFLLPSPAALGPMARLPRIGQQWERWLPCGWLQLVESVRCDRYPTSILRWICSILGITRWVVGFWFLLIWSCSLGWMVIQLVWLLRSFV